MNHLIIVFMCCGVMLVNGRNMGLISRYCRNPKKEEIRQCSGEQGSRMRDIYQHCVGAAKFEMTEFKEMDKFLCSEMNNSELNFFSMCFYGALWVNDLRGNNFTRVADWCLRKYEPKVSSRWISIVHKSSFV